MMQSRSRIPAGIVWLVCAVCAASLQGGCSSIGALVGGMADSAHRAGSTTKPAEYKGLEGKTFAVIVAADRAIQADYPDVVTIVTSEVTRRVAAPGAAKASGVVPVDDVLRFQGRRPGWVAMTPREVAAALGVERLIYVDLDEYRHTEPGNRYVWDGVASGIVGVVEADSTCADDFAFRETIRVKYPDKENTGSMEIPEEVVRLELLRRLVNRISWLFFEHEEKNTIEY